MDDEQDLPAEWHKSNPDLPRLIWDSVKRQAERQNDLERTLNLRFNEIGSALRENTRLTAGTRDLVAGVDALKTVGKMTSTLGKWAIALTGGIGGTIVLIEHLRDFIRGMK